MPFKSKLFAILAAAWAAFIFSNSLKIGASSDQMSNPIVSKVSGGFSFLGINIDMDILTLVIRKAAHFTEFMILGFLIGLIFYFMKGKFSWNWSKVLFLGLGCGVIDEFIQSFVKGRSSDVRDVLIDFGGCFVAYIIMLAIANRKSHRRL